MLLGDTTNCPGRSMDFSRDFEVDAGGKRRHPDPVQCRARPRFHDAASK